MTGLNWVLGPLRRKVSGRALLAGWTLAAAGLLWWVASRHGGLAGGPGAGSDQRGFHWTQREVVVVVADPDSSPLRWLALLGPMLQDWAPWLLLGPFAVVLARRFPFERPGWKLALAVHGPACLAFCLAAQALHSLGAPSPATFFKSFSDVRRHLEMDPPDVDGMFPAGEEGGTAKVVVRDESPWGLNLLALWRARTDLPIYWAIVSVTHAVAFHRRSVERERRTRELEASLVRARLETLRTRLQPHFLFNTLHAISALVHKDPAAADEMIGNLSELLRSALASANASTVPLWQEIDFLDRYLAIQQMRLGDRLRVERDVDPAALGFPVPSMILQPLVENAVRHGIEPDSKAGCIRIAARRSADRLHLEVRDNGPGFGGNGTPHVREGVGLSNTRSRLEEMYGAGHRFVLRNGKPSGAVVELELPAPGEPTDPA